MSFPCTLDTYARTGWSSGWIARATPRRSDPALFVTAHCILCFCPACLNNNGLVPAFAPKVELIAFYGLCVHSLESLNLTAAPLNDSAQTTPRQCRAGTLFFCPWCVLLGLFFCRSQLTRFACQFIKIQNSAASGSGAAIEPNVKFVIPETSTFLNTTNPMYSKSKYYYTLVMVNPDYPNPEAPTGPKLSWLVVNIDVTATSLQAAANSVVFPYVAPNPLKGLQRYVMLLYLQNVTGYLQPSNVSALVPDRNKFNLTKLVTELQLGTPVGGNMFRSHAEN